MAEDIAQEAFTRLIRLDQQGKAPPQPEAWLYRVVRNLAIDSLRKERRFHDYVQHSQENAPPWFRESTRSNEHESWENRCDGEFLQSRLQELPLNQRETIVAHLWGELSFREIAAMCGRSFSTVRREFHQGIETLRTYFQ